ncbi:hypothetical protein GCM10011390_48650 [Aureimonas endophytica]|uniref:KAP NTPase domain-containing protein n=1 Tax=Aureimonas endophytica TaxID=2027858 RepID=A0A917A2S0_9HYPH|nr:P-loop NTPase fold protein [Aureimonas endophytica]GGE23502.1 hypothetical protein GCM10011390_48650 [Aureimonas endophytica]
MANKNQHILDELEFFRAQSGIPFYALQINAPWGAGKTYFIKTYLDELQRQSKTDDPKSLYISLFGAQNISDLEKQATAQLFSKTGRTVGYLLSTALAGAGSVFGAGDAAKGIANDVGAKALAERLELIRDGLIIFDDIERSQMPLRDALGYINRFVEHEKFRVVVVSNEAAFKRSDASNLDKENATVLASFKEKLIGRTLLFQADPIAAYPFFVEALAAPEAREIAKREQEAALNVFWASGRENLRLLRIGIEAFGRFMLLLDPVYRDRVDGLKSIFLSCIYVSLELGSAISEKPLINPYAVSTGRNSYVIRKQDTQPTEEEQQANSIVERYDSALSLSAPTLPFKLIYDYIAHGQFSCEEINLALSISPLTGKPENVPPWRHLIEIWELDTETLLRETKRAVEKLEKHQVRDAGELLQLAGIMLWREEHGDNTLSIGLKPSDFIKKYIDELHVLGSGLEPGFEHTSLNRLTAYGYQAIGAEAHEEELVLILDLIRSSMMRTARQRFPEYRAALIDALVREDRNLHMISDQNKALGDYLRLPILAEAEVDEFSNLLLREGGLDHAALDWLTDDRYGLGRDLMAIKSELPWLKALCGRLLERIATATPPLNSFWKVQVERKLGGAIERLELLQAKPAPVNGL